VRQLLQAELLVAKGLKAKGYQYVTQLQTREKEPIGDPLYFKNPDMVGRVLREDFPEATMKWTKPIDNFIQELEQCNL
jgi:hypothetical protein